MSEMKTYELNISRLFKIMVFGMLFLFVVITIFLLIGGIFFFEEGEGLGLFIGLFLLAIVAWNYYWVLSIPHRITFSEAGEITFISLFRSREVPVSEIESIVPDPLQFFGFLVVKTQGRKIRIMNQFDGFHDLILNIKSLNPSVEFRGC